MNSRRGKKHEFSIDGQAIWLDSLNEEMALKQFIDNYGFSERWLRPVFGIKHAGNFYSADFELAVEDGDYTARALIEVKEYRRDFHKSVADRMRIVARHYSTKHIYLYTTKGNNWYKIEVRSGKISECSPPKPGVLPIANLKTPSRFVTKNYYGRKYYQNWSDWIFSFF